MRKNCNIIFISAVALIIICIALGFFTSYTFLFEQVCNFENNSGGIAGAILSIFGFAIIQVIGYYIPIILGIVIFVFTFIGYLLTFGKYKKGRIIAFKVLNTISDFIWMILLFLYCIIFELLRALLFESSVMLSSVPLGLTAIIMILIIIKIGYNIYLLYIKKGAFDNDNHTDELDNTEMDNTKFDEVIETDYQISEETIDDESNLN